MDLPSSPILVLGIEGSPQPLCPGDCHYYLDYVFVPVFPGMKTLDMDNITQNIATLSLIS